MFPCCLLLLALPLVASQCFGMGRCPSPDVQANFSMDQFLGRWYSIQMIPTMGAEGRCSEGNFVWQPDNSVLVTSDRKSDRKSWSAVLYQDMEEPAKMEFHCLTGNDYTDALMPSSHVWVLKTDYTSMAVLFSCKDLLDIIYFEFAWILSRERTLPAHVVREAMGLLQREHIDVSYMIPVNQTYCD